MEIADWARNPEILFDPEAADQDSGLLIASSANRLVSQMKAAQIEHIGSDERYLTPLESFKLASVKEEGVLAAEMLEELERTQKWVTQKRRLDLESKIATGAEARNTLIEANLRFAAYYARASMNILTDKQRKELLEQGRKIGAFSDVTKLASASASLEDRMQVATMGLIKAVDKYKPQSAKGKPTSFLAYASWSIHAALQKYVLEEEPNGIRLSTEKQSYANQLYHDPSLASEDEYSEARFWKAQRVHSSLDNIEVTVDLGDIEDVDQYEAYDESLTLAETVADITKPALTDEIEYLRLRDDLIKIVRGLSEREAKIILMRFGVIDGEPKTLKEIGPEIGGVTTERVRQLESKTMSKLRHPQRSEGLRDYFNVELSHGDSIYLGQLSSPRSNQFSSRLGKVLLSQDQSGLELDQSDSYGRVGYDSIDPIEDWDNPVRKTPEDISEQYERAQRLFTSVLLNADAHNFTVEQSFSEENSFYPLALLEEINDACGPNLRAYHIEEFWNLHMNGFANRLHRELGEKLMLDRLSLLFSHLIAERITDNDQIEIHIPEILKGKLDMFCSNLGYGEVIVHGNLGDFAGYRTHGIGNLKVVGSVGDYAASEMDGLGAISISGDAGKNLGYGSLDGTIDIDGTVKSLVLRPTFKGYVIAGRVIDVSLNTSAADTYEIISDRRQV